MSETDPPRTHRRFTLSEKIAIVRESMAPGVTASFVARRHRIAVNVLYYWRKAYRDVIATDLTRLLLTLNQQFVGRYTDADGVRDVASYSMFGLNAAYTGIRNFTLSLGVKNLLDTDPPYSRQTQSFQVGYDPALADPTGRFWYASLRYRFK